MGGMSGEVALEIFKRLDQKESRGTKMPNISEMGDQLNGHKVFFLTNLFHSQVLAGPISI
jgi:hypothetical protein